LLNPALLITSLPTNYLILTSLPTVNSIPPNLSCCKFTIISAMQQDRKKYHAFAFYDAFDSIDPK